MEFLLSHWHCILPAAVLLVAAFFMNRGSKGDKAKKDSGSLKMQNRQTHGDE